MKNRAEYSDAMDEAVKAAKLVLCRGLPPNPSSRDALKGCTRLITTACQAAL